MKTLIILTTYMLSCMLVFGQKTYTTYAIKKINNDSIKICVLQKDGKKYWGITNLLCEKVIVGTKSGYYYEPYMKTQMWHTGGIAEGDVLKKGESKIYPIDFFSKDSRYSKEYPNFLIKWKDFNLKVEDYFVHFYDDKAPLGVKGKIGDWF